MNKKYLIISIGITAVMVGGALWVSYEPEMGNADQEWKVFTDNLEAIKYKHNEVDIKDLKDKDGIWKPTKDDFKEIYKYVYGYDLVPWQTMDGTEMSPLQCMKDKDGKDIIKPNGKCEQERINLIPQWEQEWNNNVERGEFNGDVLKELREDTPQGMIDSDMVLEVESTSQKKNYFGFLKKLIKSVFAGVEFEDSFIVSSHTILSEHTPVEMGTGWTQLIQVGGCTLYIWNNTDVLSGSWSGSQGGCGDGGDGELVEIDDTMSGANYTVAITQDNGGSGDDTNIMACRAADSTHMYALRWNESDADLYIINGAGWSTIDTTATGIADNSRVELICNGTTISVEDDDAEILSAVDSTHTSVGKAALGMGGVVLSGDDVAGQILDDFLVTVEAAPPPAPADHELPTIIIIE